MVDARRMNEESEELSEAPALLLVDDDENLCAMLAEYLAPEGFVITAVHSGDASIGQALGGFWDAIILDVMLPGKSGFDVLRELRGRGVTTPILMLTARGADVDRIVGLEMGADDYLPKPFNPRELVARIRAILRRGPPLDTPADTLIMPPYEAHLKQRTLYRDGVAIELTNAEFMLIATLMKTPGEVVSRDELARAALGRTPLPTDRSLDTHISNLRRKLGNDPVGGELVRSIRGSGYLLAPPES
jgi:two-component system response regulator CpxR